MVSLLENPNQSLNHNDRQPTDDTEDMLYVNNIDIYYCHRGVLMSSSKINGSDRCLCSPSYYGDRCQYQREHLTVHLKIQTPVWMHKSHIFRVIVYLQTETNPLYDAFDLLHVPYSQNSTYKHIFYLLTPRLNESQTSLVSINVFSVSEDDVKYHSSWFYTVPFTSIFPVNRVTAWLNVDKQSEVASNCNQSCVNGVCTLSLIPANKSFCLCDKGWSGNRCDMISTKACAVGAHLFHSVCVCPLGRFGFDCYGKVDLCRNVRCQNNGTCRSLDIKSQRYVCICSESYYGDHCQYPSAKVKITINKLIIDPSIVHVPIVTVHFVNITSMVSLATFQDRFVYKNVPFNSNLTVILSQQPFLSTFVYVQLFFNTKDYYGEHYLVSFSKYSVYSVYTKILISNHCPFIDQLLSSETMSYPYMKRIKSYYKPCLNLGTKCFGDEKYMCLCDNEAHLDCFLFDHTASNCTERGYCQNGGHCIQPVQKDAIQFEFGCICSDCYYGELCQFTTAQYSMSLDSLLGQQIYADHSLTNQPFVIKITLSIIILMVLVGSLCNTCSIITFYQQFYQYYNF
ncbi:unnamed protein product [Didymodactylos carnosus]|uniref:EGF-like domain-containing protein n=1 Tax=Didymodactylos carnosus TaxID=1234261 RepID=A0A8S2S1Z4_9BILA|nr:unnamed protein product [Didymodactylos carnosus]CAF4196917.1 unnamed protein product [Didymodactylos carnosus]